MEKGILFVILTIILWGIAPILEKFALKEVSPILAITIRNTVIALILLIIANIIIDNFWHEVRKVKISIFLFIIGGGVLGGLLGMLTYFKALKLGEASRVVPIVASYPMVTAIFSALLLGEKLTLMKFIGIILIIVGVFLLQVTQK
jgi:transporter family protein